MFGRVFGLVFGLVFGAVFGAVFGLVFGAVFGLVFEPRWAHVRGCTPPCSGTNGPVFGREPGHFRAHVRDLGIIVFVYMY